MKRKTVKSAALAAIVVGVLGLLGNLAVHYLAATAARGEAASIGIIGSADGPTAIFVTGVTTGPTFVSWLVPALLLAVGLLIWVCLKKCNK